MKIDSPRSGKIFVIFVAGLFAWVVSGNSAVAASRGVALTVNVQGEGWVNSGSDSIDCPSDCTESYRRFSLVTLTATADPDSRFLGWRGACSGTRSTCRVRMRRTAGVTALFEKTADPDSTNDQTPLPDNTEVRTIQIHWPVTSSGE